MKKLHFILGLSAIILLSSNQVAISTSPFKHGPSQSSYPVIDVQAMQTTMPTLMKNEQDAYKAYATWAGRVNLPLTIAERSQAMSEFAKAQVNYVKALTERVNAQKALGQAQMMMANLKMQNVVYQNPPKKPGSTYQGTLSKVNQDNFVLFTDQYVKVPFSDPNLYQTLVNFKAQQDNAPVLQSKAYVALMCQEAVGCAIACKDKVSCLKSEPWTYVGKYSISFHPSK